MSIGAEIKRLRIEHGYTQAELGKMIGVQKSAVQKYEKGTIKNYKPEVISKLCQIFEVTPAVFFDMMHNTDRLSREVQALEQLSTLFGNQSVNLLECFQALNEEGKARLFNYAKDLIEIEKYTK